MIRKSNIMILLIVCVFTADAIALPEAPVIDRDVHMTEERQYTRPTIPPVQTSADGRVSVAHKRQEGGGIHFRLQVPEKMTTPFIDSGDGVTIYALENALADGNALARPFGYGSGHVGLCDPAGDPNSSIKNPRNCDGGDCYDLVIVSSQRRQGKRRIVGTPVTVRVENPKTPHAFIANVTTDRANARFTPFFPEGELISFFEPITVADGRLLVVRQSIQSHVTWTDSKGHDRRTLADSIYLVNDNPDDFEACDVTQWANAYPLTHAPYDDSINERYGFAMHPFRDLEGHVIEEGISIGTYPWIDKGADVVTFTTVGERLSRSNYDYECAVDQCVSDAASEERGNRNGRVMVGLWTLGKIVMMDNLVNNIDFVQRAPDNTHRNVRLYEGNGNDAFVRVGNGRDGTTEHLPLGSSGSTSFFDSNEHRFNFVPAMVPVSPRDVTWLISSGRGTDELSFDDFTNPNSFINSSMVQLMRFSRVNNPNTPERHEDVYVRDALQNGATSTDWSIPEFGQLFGNTRVEPVALGGVQGKGLWLDGDNSGVRYQIPTQPRDVLSTPWYYGLFVDKRSDRSLSTLMQFPDGTVIRITGDRHIQFVSEDGNVLHTVHSQGVLFQKGWAHIGFQLSNNNQTVKTYTNGYLVNEYTSRYPIFVLEAGTLTLGSAGIADQSFRGWVDDFKIFADNINEEVACNHAFGTLTGIEQTAPQTWQDHANRFPQVSHNALSKFLESKDRDFFTRYVCYHDYSGDYAAHISNIPNGMVSVREGINFPEGPLIQDKPRPDSSTNPFCLSCHTETSRAGLGLGALALNPNVMALDDKRRQPMQPDPLIYGNIPAGWINGLPESSFIADDNGFKIDRLVLPKAPQHID